MNPAKLFRFIDRIRSLGTTSCGTEFFARVRQFSGRNSPTLEKIVETKGVRFTLGTLVLTLYQSIAENGLIWCAQEDREKGSKRLLVDAAVQNQQKAAELLEEILSYTHLYWVYGIMLRLSELNDWGRDSVDFWNALKGAIECEVQYTLAPLDNGRWGFAIVLNQRVVIQVYELDHYFYGNYFHSSLGEVRRCFLQTRVSAELLLNEVMTELTQ
jgi:hypothetical protein